MTIEEYFGTLQQSVIETWREHLKTSNYDVHVILNDFYEDMPEKVDALIEAWMAINGKVEEYKNVFEPHDVEPKEYLNQLRKFIKDGRSLMGESELESLVDDILGLVDSTLYKLKELNENMGLSKYLKNLLNEAKTARLDTFVNFDLQSDIYNALCDLAAEYEFNGKKFDEKDVKKALDWFMKNFFVTNESLNESASSSDINKATKLIGHMSNDDDLISISSCFNWLDDCNWKIMKEKQYAEIINDINDDIDIEYAEEYYAPVMRAMAKVGKEETIEILKRLGATQEELEEYDIK